MAKKERKNTLMICLIALVVVIIVLLAIIPLSKTGTPSAGEIESAGDYYTLSYEASYNSNKLLFDDAKYEIIDNSSRLNDFLKNFQDGKNADFGSNFFASKNLLVTFGEIGAEINTLEFDGASVKMVVYYDCPETTMDSIHTFNTFLIPIDKTITDVDITSSCYPDRVY